MMTMILFMHEKMKRKKLESERKEITGPRLLKMVWDREKGDLQAKRCIAELASCYHILGVKSRPGILKAHKALIMGILRLYLKTPKSSYVLINLARGHALLYGRNYITLEDVPITIKTALSTAQIERVSLFDLLLAHNGTLNTTQMEDYLSFSPPTIRRIMTEFKATRLVKVEAVGSSHQQSMYLKDEFKWFLADEFKKLREGFIPTDYHEFMKEPKKEKSPPYSTPNYSSGI